MFEQWAEIDLNPFLTFNENGKIQYTNSEAQYLLNKVPAKVLYDLALQYAPKSYGFTTSYVNLDLGSYLLYAVSVGYENDSEIALKLYKSSQPKKETKLNQNAQMTNLFSIVDLAISTNKMKSKAVFVKGYDPSIPDFKIVINDLIKVLNYVYTKFANSKKVTTNIRYKTGEYVKVENKKRPLICIDLYCDQMEDFTLNTAELESFATRVGILLEIQSNTICINLPLILE
ncbi:MAG: hypothetical protein U9N30_04820 [Campylobacterota bacterium]|nr:hypothetical protein [Campylobacterota bacterium]